MDTLRYDILTDIGALSDSDIVDINRIFQQFTPGIAEVTRDSLLKPLTQGHVVLLVRSVPDNGRIVGSSTLIVYYRPTGAVGIIEQVMVDEAFRRRGIAKKMMEMVIAEAKRRGLTRVDLTSHKDRADAHAFYTSLGFENRGAQTVPFRYLIP